MWSDERTFARSDHAIAQGKLWRAKEILQGNIATQEFHPELYKRYGQLLLEMGDCVEAGKYLFLSGARNRQYQESISLFLTKHHRDPGRIVGAFPSRARSTPRASFPPSAQEDMKELGIPTDLYQHIPEYRTTWKDHVTLTAVSLLLVLIVICAIVGAVVLIRLASTALA